MPQHHENTGYSFEAHETFEWGMNHRMLMIKNALGSLKEECFSESQVNENHSFKDLLDTTARVLEALEHSFERDFVDEGVIFSPKSSEPWD